MKGFTFTAVATPTAVHFTATQTNVSPERVCAQGTLKWDGCLDVSFERLHFCGLEQAEELGELMRQIYALGPGIEHWEGE